MKFRHFCIPFFYHRKHYFFEWEDFCDLRGQHFLLQNTGVQNAQTSSLIFQNLLKFLNNFSCVFLRNTHNFLLKELYLKDSPFLDFLTLKYTYYETTIKLVLTPEFLQVFMPTFAFFLPLTVKRTFSII